MKKFIAVTIGLMMAVILKAEIQTEVPMVHDPVMAKFWTADGWPELK